MKRAIRQTLFRLCGVLILVGLAVWIDIPQHPSISLGAFSRDLNLELGLDLQGGSHLVYKADIVSSGAEDPAEAIAGVRDVIERRVNAFGVSEPVVQTNKTGDEYRVIVELAGVHDPQEAIRQIGETPQLDFRKEIDGADLEGQLNIDGNIIDQGPLFQKTDLTGRYLKRATVDFDQVSGGAQVSIEFDSEGSELFAKLTQENLGKRIAIYLDGVPISAPTVQAEITNGSAVITGGFTVDEARELARRLNAGALPVPIELIGQQTIGPTLGERSIEQSVQAGLLGLVFVMVWMIVYYRLPGIISAIALIMYAVLFLAIAKLLPVTLTLAGIAGLILSIGMAVDANVLIFERFREQLRAGKTVAFALKDGFSEAWDSIKASNISSLLTALVLYGFGTSIVRGFAVTFSIGVLLSMFTAITITRTLLVLVTATPKTHKKFLLGAPVHTPPL